MGRLLRRTSSDKIARLVIYYVAGTYEDPAQGGHETFVDEIQAAADSVYIFPPHAPARTALEFLTRG